MSCRRLIWLRALLRWEGYAPLAAGLRAIIKHVDCFRRCTISRALPTSPRRLPSSAPPRRGFHHVTGHGAGGRGAGSAGAGAISRRPVRLPYVRRMAVSLRAPQCVKAGS